MVISADSCHLAAAARRSIERAEDCEVEIIDAYGRLVCIDIREPSRVYCSKMELETWLLARIAAAQQLDSVWLKREELGETSGLPTVLGTANAVGDRRRIWICG